MRDAEDVYWFKKCNGNTFTFSFMSRKANNELLLKKWFAKNYYYGSTGKSAKGGRFLVFFSF